MHVDELLSAEFPLNMGNGGHHASGPLNSGAQANIMEGLDDLFGDDFSTTNAATITTTAVTTGAIAHSSSNNVGLPMVHLPQGSQPQHATAQALPPNMHFPTSGPTHSPQPRVLQQHPHQQPSPAALDSPSAIPAPLTPGHHTPGARITPQTPQPVSTAHVSHAPQITAGMHAMQQNRQQAVATPGLPQQYQQQQAVLQQQQAALQQHQQQQQQAAQHHAHLAQQSLQPTGAPRPVFPSPQHHHAALNQATALLPRPVQPNIVQMPSTTSTPVVPNGHTPIPTVATPAIVTPAGLYSGIIIVHVEAALMCTWLFFILTAFIQWPCNNEPSRTDTYTCACCTSRPGGITTSSYPWDNITRNRTTTQGSLYPSPGKQKLRSIVLVVFHENRIRL